MGDEEEQGVLTPAVDRPTLLGQLLQQHYDRLSMFQLISLQNGAELVGMTSIASGVLATNLFRGMLKIRKYYLLSCLPCVIPFGIGTIGFHQLVTQPLIKDKFSCSVCMETRAALIGMGVCGAAPVFLSAYLNALLVPKARKPVAMGNFLWETIKFAQPVFSKMKYLILFEGLFSMWIAGTQFSTIQELLQMAPNSETIELLLK